MEFFAISRCTLVSERLTNVFKAFETYALVQQACFTNRLQWSEKSESTSFATCATLCWDKSATALSAKPTSNSSATTLLSTFLRDRWRDAFATFVPTNSFLTDAELRSKAFSRSFDSSTLTSRFRANASLGRWCSRHFVIAVSNFANFCFNAAISTSTSFDDACFVPQFSTFSVPQPSHVAIAQSPSPSPAWSAIPSYYSLSHSSMTPLGSESHFPPGATPPEPYVHRCRFYATWPVYRAPYHLTLCKPWKKADRSKQIAMTCITTVKLGPQFAHYNRSPFTQLC